MDKGRGEVANARRNCDRVLFSANQHINPTNVCVLRNTCVFCSFARMPQEGDKVWIDPTGYHRAVAERKAAFEKELHKQQAEAHAR